VASNAKKKELLRAHEIGHGLEDSLGIRLIGADSRGRRLKKEQRHRHDGYTANKHLNESWTFLVHLRIPP
jgi:hypothetical protein